MMSARQSAFRAEYRRRIERWYNPALHVLSIYVLGGLALWFFISNLRAPIGWWQWAVVPVVLLVSNMLEWAMHLYVMHRPRRNPIARAIYSRHTLMHHQFFTEHNYTIEGPRDFRIVLFPPYTQIAALALAAPGSFVLGLVLGANAGWLSMIMVVSHYMIYEFFHFCCHVPDNWFVRNAPFVNTIRRHHVAHHEQAIMMHYNMNLTFPISDWLFGTSDLRRGLLGTLFNGYSQKHVKQELRRARPLSAAAPSEPDPT
ncbi:MAG: fatty acid hydroxylase family protein [Hyphomonadaceae bacterium]